MTNEQINSTETKRRQANQLLNNAHVYPVSLGQRRMWLAREFAQGSAYHVDNVFSIDSKLSENRVRSALTRLVARHEVLRTVYPDAGGTPVALVDISGADMYTIKVEHGVHSETVAWQLVRQQRARPFNLSSGPLLHVYAVEVESQRTLLLFSLHHISADGWSVDLIIRDFLHFYREQQTQLPEARPYSEFAALEHSVGQDRLDAARDHWLKQLEMPLPEFDWVKKLDAAQGANGCDTRRFTISRDALGRMDTFANEVGLTRYMSLLTAFAIALNRFGGDDLLIGSPASNRVDPAFEHTVGYLGHTMPIRLNVRADQSILSFLRSVRAKVLAGLEFQDVPFDLVTDLQPNFSCLFVLQSEPVRSAASEDDVRVYAVDSDQSKAPLSMHLSEQQGEILGRVEYDPSRVGPLVADGIEAIFRHLVNELPNLGRVSLGSRELLPPDMLTQILGWSVSADADSAVRPEGDSLAEVFHDRAVQDPHATALTTGSEVWSYTDLHRAVSALSSELADFGVRTGDRVGIGFRQGTDAVVSILAVLHVGGVYVPLDPDQPRSRLQLLISESRLVATLTNDPSVAALDTRTIYVDRERLRNAATAPTAPAPVGRDAVSHLMYTSGSTGTPKGVEVSHASVLALLRDLDFLSLGSESAVLLAAPISFDAATLELFPVLLRGGRIVVLESDAADLEHLSSTVEDHQVSVAWLTAGLFQHLTDAQIARMRNMSALLTGGDVVSPEAAARFLAAAPGVRLFNGYGPTENTVFATTHLIDRPVEGNDNVPIGRPVATTRAYVLDSSDRLAPPGAVGELCLSGEGLTAGYTNNPSATKSAFVPAPSNLGDLERGLYRTGDLVNWDDDGRLRYHGRSDWQVKIRGFRIEPGEVRVAVLALDGVKDSYVIPVGEQGDRRLAAYYVPAGPALTPADVRDRLSDEIPPHLIPTYLVPLERLPLLSTGKCDVSALPDPRVALATDDRQPWTELTATQQLLCTIWSQVLRVGKVGADDDFFELGGDSIRGIQVVASAKREGLSVRPRDLLAQRTVRRLAEVADAREAPAQPQPTTTSDAQALTPIQEWFLQLDLSDRNHFTMSQAFEVGKSVELGVVTAALNEVKRAHPALSEPCPTIDDVDRASTPLVRTLDLRETPSKQHYDRLVEATSEARAGISLRAGDLLKAVLARRADGPDWLLLIVHHMAVDAVSWRIILEDLQRVCHALTRGETADLGVEYASRGDWLEALRRYTGGLQFQEDVAYWTHAPSVPSLPRDYPEDDAANTRASLAQHEVTLTTQETSDLLRSSSESRTAHLGTLLAALLAETISEWTAEPAVSLMLEGHGREDIDDSVDLSRTVGWFTSLYPVTLNVAGHDHADVVRQLNKVPQNGLPYGVARYLTETSLPTREHPAVSFNYMGIVDGSGPSGLITPIALDVANDRPSNGPRQYEIELNCSVEDGKMVLTWKYSTALHRQNTVADLATAFVDRVKKLASIQPLPAKNEYWPTAGAQDGLIYHSLTEASGVYLVQWEATFEGDLDSDALLGAWTRALARHPAMRVSFENDPTGQVAQRVHSSVDVPTATLDWTHKTTEQASEALTEFLAEDRRRGFEIARPPLYRLTAIRLQPKVVKLVWTYHHALVDGWTFSHLLDEAHADYLARVRQGKAALAELPPYSLYVDYVENTDRGEDQRYWSEQLAGVSGPTTLPPDPQPELPSDVDRYAAQSTVINDGQAVAAAARKLGVTLNTLLLGAWALVLGRHSGETDVTVGVTGSGRPAELPEAQDMVGLFINTLPLRVTLDCSNVRDWLATIQDRQWAMREHEHNTLSDVREWAGLPGDVPLFEHIFVFENYPAGTSDTQAWGDAHLVAKRSHERTNYALNVTVKPEAGLSIHVDYDRHLYSDAIVHTLLEHISATVEELIADSRRPVRDVPIARSGEIAQLTSQFAPPYNSREDTGLVHDLVEQWATIQPESVAVSYAGSELTYGELDRRANGLAQRLHDEGIRIGDRVGICTTRCPEMMVGILAILKAGGVFVPISHKFPPGRIEHLVEVANLKAMVTRDDLADPMPVFRLPVYALEHFDASAEIDEMRTPVAVSPEDLCYIYFTSGSTGTPKGVPVSHRALASLYAGCRDVLRLEDDTSVFLQMANMSFDVFTEDWVRCLCSGKRLVLCPGETLLDGKALLDLIEAENVNFAEFIPVVLRSLLDYAESAGRDLSQLSIVVVGGDVWYGEEYTRVQALGGPDLRVVNSYGVTEVAIDSAMFEAPPGHRLRAGVPVPLSRPWPNQQLFILDQAGRVAPRDVPGELWIGGAGVGTGYLNDTFLTEQRFTVCPADPQGGRAYRTGDLARYTSSGLIELYGRIDSQVKIRGFRMELGEIERAMKAHPGVADAVAAVHRDEDSRDDAVLVGYFVPAEGTSPTATEMGRHLKKQLAWYMVPGSFVRLEQLPVSRNGKVDRFALPKPSMHRPDVDSDMVPARTDLQKQLCAIWREVLRIEQVGVQDNFIDLGGNSMRAMQIATRVRQDLERDIGIRDVLLYPSVEDFEAFLESQHVPDTP